MSQFISALRSGDLLLMDGAMGTELQRRAQEPGADPCERFNLSDPELVQSIHRDYVSAGARVLLTNTFQANPSALHRHNLAGQFHEIWESAIRLARGAAAFPFFVLADVGPIENLTREVARGVARACARADGVLLETWTSIAELELFATVLKEEVSLPLLVSFTFRRGTGSPEWTTFEEGTPEECARAAADVGALAIGANCGVELDIADMAELARRYRTESSAPIFMRPNAGTPVQKEGAWVFPRTPRMLAEELPRLLDAEVTMVGGCCGTTPEHIEQFGKVLAGRGKAGPKAQSV